MRHHAARIHGRFDPVLLACVAPALAFFVAFWILPMTRLVLLPAQQGWATYFAVLTNGRYLQSLWHTLLLSLAVTVATVLVGGLVGVSLARARAAGQRTLADSALALLTTPLSFPGVVIGFFVILTGGRQGVIADLTQSLGLGRITFAYGLTGLFLAYLYFSLPRVIATFSAAGDAMDAQLEEAARSLGASGWRVVLDVWIPALAPVALASGAMVFATAMGAFGTAFTLASQFEVLPITIYNAFTNYANFALAASLSIALGLMTWLVLLLARLAPQAGDASNKRQAAGG